LQWRGERWAAAFQHAHRQRIGTAGTQAQLQRRGRGALGRARLAQHEGRSVVRMRGQLQPAQALGPQTRRQPGQHGPHMAALQRLL
jgi:hypothetical protein